MKEKVSRKFWSKLAAGFFAIALIMTGVLFAENGSSEVFASGTTKDISVREVSDISAYRTEDGYTYPKPTEEGKTDYIFAGWYADSACTEAYTTSTIEGVTKAYAKYVPAETMDVKFQVLAGTNVASEKTDLRMVSTVDSTNYQKVGYSIIANGKELLTDTQSVFKRIKSNTEGLEYGYSPVVFDTDSEYFVTFTIKNIKNKNFDRTYNVRPYWVTMDGTTVYGCGRNVKVSDSYNGIANVPVRIYADNVEAGSAITVTYDATDFTYLADKHEVGKVDSGVTVTNIGVAEDGTGSITCTTSQAIADANGMLVNLRFQINSTASSNEVFEMTGIGASDYLYRVFSTTYQGEPDTSWYDGFETENTFVITTPADLYGFAQIVNATSGDYKSEQFAGDTVRLGADITVNTGNATNWGTTVPTYAWTPIGDATTFAGTFDGGMHTINGIYLNTATAGAGFFGEIAATGDVHNLYIKNSLFQSTTTDLGSVAGISRGTISTVFSDAIVVSSQLRSGGIVGSMLNTASVDNCWFDGTITLTTANGKQSGGIVGYIAYGTANTNVSITNCLYTGDLTFAATSTTWGLRIGGIAGGAHDYHKPTITLENCLSAGTVKQTSGSTSIPAASAVYGGFDEPRDTVLNLENVFATNECCSTGRIYHQYFASATATGNPPTVNGEGTLMAESELTGYTNRNAISSLGIYTNNEKDDSDYWVITEGSTPELKSFCEEWVDFGWYDNRTDGEDYVIATAEEMYALTLISAEDTFEDDVIKLGDDIKLNNGVASVWAETDDTTITGSLRTWTPIGKTNAFVGTFDGQMNTISGIYLNTIAAKAGLFGEIAAAGNVRNLYIENSLFQSTTTDLGSVAGISRGTISTVFSDAIVVSSQLRSGGIVGSMLNTASVDNCWFDGTISLTSANGKQSGGIVGYIANGTANSNVSITNCLYTGDLTFDATSTKWGLRIGGIAGGAHDYQKPTITLENCVSAGSVAQVDGSEDIPAVSAVYGGFDEPRDVTLNLVNVYGTNECCATGRIYHQYFANASTSAPPTINGTGTLIATSELHGVAGYKNTLLDFETAWAARSGDVPGIKLFVNDPLNIANVIRPDTSWYNAEETRQEILDEADMYGFMELMAEGNTFADKEIYLMADLSKMNKVESGTIDKWMAGTEAPDNQWVAGTKFAGKFDGQMHTISGIYLNTTAAKAGLFGEIAATGEVSNFYIKDSFFKSTNTDVGSVAGIHHGTISAVFSDAIVVSSQLRTGGIVGSMLNAASVDQCWFDGVITLTTDNGKQSGGIVGYIANGTANTNVSITNCLYTGDLTFTATAPKWGLRIGGIAGGAHDYHKPTITLENCLSAGTVIQKNGSTSIPAVSTVYGGFDEPRDVVLNLVNVYGTNECCTTGRIYHQYFANASTSAPPAINGTGILMGESELQGTAGYQNTLFDFEDTWVAREGDVPTLKAFTNEIGTEADLTGIEQNNWYDADETVFGIASTSALKAFSTYSATYDFTDKKVLLLDNIEVNAVEEGTLAAWKAGTGTLPTSWTPIGVTKAFAGTFDGQMHTISGVYLNTTTAKAGLFGQIAATGNVSNFYLKDSYFKSTATDMGSIVGISKGTISTVFSDAVIVSSQVRTGGIVGSMLNTTSVDHCWFDGEMTLTTDNGKQAGGIVGYIAYGTANTNVSITNCLYTGDLTFTATAPKWGLRIGGIVGGAHDYHKPTITLENCLSAGTVKQTSGSTSIPAVSAVYGGFDEPRDVVLNLVNVYATNECCATGRIYHQYFANASTSAPPTINGTGTLLKEADLYGTWGCQNTLFDFENDWAARSNDVPGLKVFAGALLSVADTIRPDTSWYDAEATDLEIQDAADMYGFMKLLAEGSTFEGQTVTVMADLVMNPTDENTVSKWQAGSEVPNNKWVSSYTGKTTNFAGTFDGNEKTISGIYCVGDYEYLGLFGTIQTGGTVKNFKLTNSYFKQTGTGSTGSIAGEVQGTIDGVYTDAIVEGTATYIGGIAALTSGLKYSISTGEPTTTSTTTDDNGYTVIEQTVEVIEGRHVVNIKNCWFDGVVNAETTEEWARIGGFVASPTQGRLDMDNCLFTGTIYTQAESSNTRVGGFVGTRSSSSPTATKTTTATDDEAKTITKVTTNTSIIYEDTNEAANTMVYIDSSIAAGQIINSGVAEIGSAVGYLSHGKFTNVFVTRDTYPVTHRVATTTFTGQPIQTYNTDRLIGYCVEPTYGFTLDFANDWSMRLSGVPVPKALEGVVGAEGIVDVSTLTAEIGLDTWSKTLAEAVDYGMGSYVVSADATYDTYSTYLTTVGTLGFTKYADNSASDMDDDGVYNAIYTKDAGDWVLDITFVQKEGKIYISISTIGKDGLSDNLQATEANIALANATNETTKEVSFSMLELLGAYGNGFVFKLPNGHFMINDGGKITESDQLLSYLKKLAGSDKVVIDAWVITHTHEDHCGVAQTIFDNDAWADVQLNAIYITEANDAAKLLEGASAKVIEDTNLSFRGLLSLTQEDGVSKPAIHRMHMGERYYFSGLTMDVIQAHEQIPYTDHTKYGDIDSFNYTSTNCVYTLTNTGKKILIGGDSNNVNMQYMMMAYGKNYETYNQSSQQHGGISKTLSNINVFAAYHHGKNVICTFQADRYDGYVGKSVATDEWADYLLKNTNNSSEFKFDAVLFPYKEVFDMTKYTGTYGEYINIWVGDDDSIMYPYNMSVINQYYIDNANAYYTYGYEDYVDGVKTTAETRHGSVQFIYKEDKSVEITIHPSNITQ